MIFSRPLRNTRFYLWLGLSFLAIAMLSDLPSHPDHLPARIMNHVWHVSMITVLHYLFFEYTMRVLSWKRFFLSFFAIIAQMMIYSWGMYGWKQLGIALHIYTPLVAMKSINAAVSDQMMYSMMSLLFFAIVRHVYHYIRLQHTTQQLKLEKQAAELNYLKSQTNPHFLFNTLNNIYSLSRDKSDLAPESILRLSKILRYMLYEAGGDYISVDQELKIIGDYLALEGLRYDESLHVNFHHDVEDMKQALPPLLLMPLVENAFKHGVSETRGRPFVDIHLMIRQRQLTFIVKNSTELSTDRQVKENIGLSNLRRQLELLFKDYKLDVEQGERVFEATLKINLASHV